MIAKRRKNWGPETVKLSERLGARLEAEVDASLALGRSIAAARETAQLTQPQLATQAGVQQADISRIERGLGNPTRDTLIKLVDALGMQLSLQPKTPELYLGAQPA
uniref:helix-turn-helix domain-containing protein n=1 Tax=Arthrobacter sp. TaxID=1667 RepID=UPI00159ED04F|nr:helix-turn-helix transcriptional regulator [Arthrobacter sp.]